MPSDAGHGGGHSFGKRPPTRIGFLLSVFGECAGDEAIIWKEKGYSYGWLLDAVAMRQAELEARGIGEGDVVALEGDFSPNSAALMLALIERGCIVATLTESVAANKERFMEIAEVGHCISLDGDDKARFSSTGREPKNALLLRLKAEGKPGVIFFSSGSTGEPKAAVHDFMPILDKFRVRKRKKRMITFLLFDHMGGVNTLLYILSNGGTAITVQERTPDAVLSLVERHKAQILPVSPSFLNMALLGGAFKRHNLSSLERITYGTEAMPESTLKAINALFPNIELQQTYGLSEVGVLRSRSEASDSLWVKIGGEGFETRVVDGMLQIKAESAMLGYLNAPSPFTDDGWLMTGDEVEVRGEYCLIKGRRSEIINVGGQKVYPAEVENVIMQMPGVLDVAVSSEENPIVGNIVTAKVRLSGGESPKDFMRRMRLFCRDKLQPYQVPQKVTLVDEGLASARFKKIRR